MMMSCRPLILSPAALCATHFGFTPASCSELDSYNDRNYKVTNEQGGAFVLKVHNHLETVDREALQVRHGLATLHAHMIVTRSYTEIQAMALWQTKN